MLGVCLQPCVHLPKHTRLSGLAETDYHPRLTCRDGLAETDNQPPCQTESRSLDALEAIDALVMCFLPLTLLLSCLVACAHGEVL